MGYRSPWRNCCQTLRISSNNPDGYQYLPPKSHTFLVFVKQKLLPSPTLHIELSKEIEEVEGRKRMRLEKWCSFPTMEHAIDYGSSTDLFTFPFWHKALSFARLQRLDLIDFIGKSTLPQLLLVFQFLLELIQWCEGNAKTLATPYRKMREFTWIWI